jgi:phosphoribosylanthranilate isomerase
VVKVKICGITEVGDARCAADAGAWAIGLNFYPPSPRHVAVERAAEISREVAGQVLRVGLFVDVERAAVRSIMDTVPLDALQFHGSETPDDCRGWPLPVIKAVRVRDAETLRRAFADYPVDFILADAYVEGLAGGTGRQIVVEPVEAAFARRLILAGGLDADNVAAAVTRWRPFAVDVASGVESAPGKKDPEKVKRFIAHAQHA